MADVLVRANRWGFDDQMNLHGFRICSRTSFRSCAWAMGALCPIPLWRPVTRLGMDCRSLKCHVVAGAAPGPRVAHPHHCAPLPSAPLPPASVPPPSMPPRCVCAPSPLICTPTPCTSAPPPASARVPASLPLPRPECERRGLLFR